MQLLQQEVQVEMVYQTVFQVLLWLTLEAEVVEKGMLDLVLLEQVEQEVEEMVLKFHLHQEQLEQQTLVVEQVVAVYFQMVYLVAQESLL
jgi:hypothetical protein